MKQAGPILPGRALPCVQLWAGGAGCELTRVGRVVAPG